MNKIDLTKSLSDAASQKKKAEKQISAGLKGNPNLNVLAAAYHTKGSNFARKIVYELELGRAKDYNTALANVRERFDTYFCFSEEGQIYADWRKIGSARGNFQWLVRQVTYSQNQEKNEEQLFAKLAELFSFKGDFEWAKAQIIAENKQLTAKLKAARKEQSWETALRKFTI